jgi:hypothetical protein
MNKSEHMWAVPYGEKPRTGHQMTQARILSGKVRTNSKTAVKFTMCILATRQQVDTWTENA